VLVVVLRTVLRRPGLVTALSSLLNAFSAIVVVALLGLLTSETILAARGNESEAARAVPQARPGEGTGEQTGVVVPTAPHPARRPDIYYIVLDSYGRGDVLKEIYGYDNTPFLEGLR